MLLGNAGVWCHRDIAQMRVLPAHWVLVTHCPLCNCHEPEIAQEIIKLTIPCPISTLFSSRIICLTISPKNVADKNQLVVHCVLSECAVKGSQ